MIEKRDLTSDTIKACEFAALAYLCERNKALRQKLLDLAQDGAVPLRADPGAVARQMKIFDTWQKESEDFAKYRDGQIEFLTIFDLEYPPLLTHSYHPPLMLFYRGELPAAEQLCIAVVGSRKSDMFASRYARELCAQLVQRGACVVSGLAIGIDSAAHRGSLEHPVACPTVAVLGSGLNTVYPSSNVDLAKEIIERGGAVLSQFGPDERPYPANFLNRNRIIAGMSQATVVIQAGERSGSLVTARYALEEGRDVYVVPPGFDDKRFMGSLKLMQQGAQVVLSADDLIPVPGGDVSKSVKNSNTERDEMLEFLNVESVAHLNELGKRFGQDAISRLVDLELDGVIRRLPGNYITLA